MPIDILLVNTPSNLRMKKHFGKDNSFLTILKSAYLDDIYHSFPGENLGLEYLAASLRKNSFKTEILDCCLDEIEVEAIIDAVHYSDPAIVAFTSTNQTFHEVEEVSKKLREFGFSGHITVGGLFASISAKEILSGCRDIDSVCLGDGEVTICELVAAVKNKASFDDIKGLSYRSQIGIIEGEPAYIEDLNKLPMPSREQVLQSLKKKFSVSISSSRGCPYSACSFCYASKYWRARSASSVLYEVEFLINNFHIDWITFVDEDFIGQGKSGILRVEKIIEGLIRMKKPVEFMIDTRVNKISKALFTKLKSAGLRRVFLGIESGSDTILKIYNKGQNLKQIEAALCILEELEIEIVPGFIFFDPFSEMFDLIKSFELFRKIGHYDLFRFTHKLNVDKGMPVFHSLLEQNRLKIQKWGTDYNFSSDEIGQIYNSLWNYIFRVFPDYLQIYKNNSLISDEDRKKIKNNHSDLMKSLIDGVVNYNYKLNQIVDKYYLQFRGILAGNLYRK